MSRKKMPEYQIWKTIRKNRSISWNDFEQFILDVGLRPTDIHLLLRKDLNKSHSKENSLWITTKDYWKLYGNPNPKFNSITHNKRYTSEYKSWQAMKERCNNPNKDGYKYYGGRGIKICEQWNKNL